MLNAVRCQRRFGRQVVEPVLRRVLGHDGHGQNDGNVIARFLGQHAAAVKLPEIGVAGALHGRLHRAGAGVVGGHGEVPVAELVVEIFQVTGGGAGGFFGILAVVQPPVALQAVAGGAAGHELPHAAGAGARKRQRMKAGFGLRQVNQVLRHAFFAAGCAGSCRDSGRRGSARAPACRVRRWKSS